MTQRSFVLIIWSNTEIARRKRIHWTDISAKTKCDKELEIWQLNGKGSSQQLSDTLLPFPIQSFFPCTAFDLKPCTESQKKKGYLLTVLLSPWRDKRVSTKCCNYSERVRSALCSLFKSRHCSWKLSGETSINRAANICICIAQQSLNFITHYRWLVHLI